MTAPPPERADRDRRILIDSIPSIKDHRKLRACILCGLIKSEDQFEASGCNNCERFLGLKHDREKVLDCTSINFDGMIAMMQPDDSWVSKWQKISRHSKGVYAISVSGNLSAGTIQELKSMGVRYKQGGRDTSIRN